MVVGEAQVRERVHFPHVARKAVLSLFSPTVFDRTCADRRVAGYASFYILRLIARDVGMGIVAGYARELSAYLKAEAGRETYGLEPDRSRVVELCVEAVAISAELNR
jgi:hypothetical protein